MGDSKKKKLPNLSDKRTTYLTLILLCLINISCVKQINLYEPDDDEEGNKSETPDVVERVEDLKIESLTLRPEENEFIYGNVDFSPNDDKTVWTATIRLISHD